jgi:predicted nuclease of predicted toxin-antitoxin system
LLLDNNLSPRIARCLQVLFDGEHEIVALHAKFSQATPDLEWISALSQEDGWAVLTKDLRLRTRPHERAALDQSRIVYFFLAGSWSKHGVEETAARLIRLVPKMAAAPRLAFACPPRAPWRVGLVVNQRRGGTHTVQ